MIIGLDHISFNCCTKKNFHKKFIDYYKLFEKKSINHKEKNLFLSKVFKKYLVSFYSSYKNLPPIEKTYYSFAKDKSKSIKVNKNKIILFVKLKKKEILFLNRAFKLKPKKKGRHINFFSLHDKKKYKIFIRKKKKYYKELSRLFGLHIYMLYLN